MKVQLYSDLHLEFESFEVACEGADVVVFAGDIHVGIKGAAWLKSLCIDRPVIYVMGNHEYYKSSYPSLLSKVREELKSTNIFLLENEKLVVDGVNFHGCTLWTDFCILGDPRIAGYECEQVVTDFKKIKRVPGYSKLRAKDVSEAHMRSRKWLSKSLQASDGINVVITHHAPSILSVPKQFQVDITTSAYASNLEQFIREHKPDFWLHGHIHESADYHISQCRVVCNPRGYSGEFNPRFELQKLIDVYANSQS